MLNPLLQKDKDYLLSTPTACLAVPAAPQAQTIWKKTKTILSKINCLAASESSHNSQFVSLEWTIDKSLNSQLHKPPMTLPSGYMSVAWANATLLILLRLTFWQQWTSISPENTWRLATRAVVSSCSATQIWRTHVTSTTDISQKYSLMSPSLIIWRVSSLMRKSIH